ncbi:MAG TPA: penicillin acylase family protein [Kofleriaceae bacterium]|nr:penicillin acylase family protein [Kofleriaceae bacterium]
MRGFSIVVAALVAGASSCQGPSDGLTDRDALGHHDVTIIRDEYGVPHLHAASERALFYAVGYVQGQDRLWQAETLRRAATGTLAEWFGPSRLQADIQARLVFGPAERRAALLAETSAETQLVFEAFADGMNAWIDEARATGALPQEYAVFGVEPRPWTVDDSVAVFLLLGSQFGWNGGDELDNAAQYADLVARLGPAEGARAFADTHYLEDPSAPTTIPGGEGVVRGMTALPVRVDTAAARAAREVADHQAAHERSLELAGLHRGPRSNAILIGPSMSADGHALLMGGPQMGYGAPQINHELGLHGAGFDVTGMSIAGFPLVPIGVGRGYAWTLTTGGTDNVDYFAEQLDPGNPGRYWYQGAWHDLACRVETFAVKGAPSTMQTLCSSVHGPIVAVVGGVAYAMAAGTAGTELQSYEAWLDMGRARSFEEFESNLAAVSYNFNVFYADAQGTIAYWHVGAIPVRAAGANPFFPEPGDGSSDWQGFMPFDEMPHVVNPEQGWLVNWNNKPRADWPNSSAGFWDWGPVHRVNTLRALVAAQSPGSFTLDTLAEINRRAGLTTDSPSGSAAIVIVSTMLDDMLDAVDCSVDPRLREIVSLLRGWDWLQTDDDEDGRYDSPAVAVFNTWWQATLEDVCVPELGAGIDPTLCAQIVYRLLAGSAAAVPVQASYLDEGETIRDALSRDLVVALDELAARFGTADVAAWLQPRAEIEWTPGGIGTVPNTLWMNRGTYNQLVHLGRGPQLYGKNVVAPGQSGDYRSPHFADQLPLYATWQYKPMRLRRADQRAHAESITRLAVPGS